jgi:phosphoglycolate phosphatase
MTSAPTLVLDLDGTLVDTAGDLTAALNVVLANEGMAPIGLDEARKMIGDGARAMLQAGFAANGVDPTPERIDTLFATLIDYYSEHIADLSAPYPGALEALDRFSAKGWRLAVCTNKLEALARKLLEQLGIADRFETIAGQDTFGARKPDPRHLSETIVSAGGDPLSAVMVGDSEIDLATAQAAEIPFILVSFGYCRVPLDELRPNRTIDHFDELFAAANQLVRV